MNIEDIAKRMMRVGLSLPTLYMPHTDINLMKWAVIACDQFIHDREYWHRVADTVGDAPSTLHYIIPEIYLDSVQMVGAARARQQRMRADISAGTLRSVGRMAVYISRMFPNGKERTGLLCALDLERYHYEHHKSAIIRATEDIFRERLAPRVTLRQQSDLELPHILVLYNDPHHTLRDLVARHLATTPQSAPLYTTPLMHGGGSVTGYALSDAESLAQIADAFEAIHRNAPERALFFVGDGNHSLAAAKEHWEILKRTGVSATHPARYALAEFMNIHDPGLTFEPIHKYIAIHAQSDHRLCDFKALAELIACESRRFMDMHSIPTDGIEGEIESANVSRIEFRYRGTTTTCAIPSSLPADVALMQIMSRIPKEKYPFTLLFAHDVEEFVPLDRAHNGIAIKMPSLNRNAILEYVATRGTLPKKSFSMGRPLEKRYYFECRKIVDE